jgi:hypothetical protein
MDDLVYVGFVVAGAVTLVIEAYRNFNAPGARHPFELHPILKEVEVKNLCTTGEIIVGFAFYAALYLIAFAILLTSAEVYGLLLKASSAFGEIGPANTGSDAGGADIAGLLNAPEDRTKPIAVSALIIASLSLGAVKPIESTMRALAHRLAGVPRGIYKVIENLQRVPYDTIVQGYPTPLTVDFEEVSRGRGRGSASLKHSYDQIAEALGVIDCLRLATSSSNRSIYFPLYSLERMSVISDRIDKEYEGVVAEIGKLKSLGAPATGTGQAAAGQAAPRQGGNAQVASSEAVLEQQYSNLGDKAKALAANMMAFFAVLFIRNNRAVYNPPRHIKPSADGIERVDPIAKVREYVFIAERDEKNAFALAIFAAFLLSFLTTFALYNVWQYWRAEADPSLYLEYLQTSIAAATGDLENHKHAMREFVRSQFNLVMTTATWDQVLALAITVIPVLLVIIGREVRIEEQSWSSEWRFRQFPFLRFFTMSLLSGLVAVFLAALAKAGAVWWEAGLHLTDTHIITLFRENGRFIALQAGAAIILAMSVLAILDVHADANAGGRKSAWAKMMATAVIGGVSYIVYQWLVQFISSPYPIDPTVAWFSRTTRDTLIYSSLPFFFLLIFSAFLKPGSQTIGTSPAAGRGSPTPASMPTPAPQGRA